ncbi:hypothetical protein J2W30_003683 [Variovorax boronicumulans]|uniref:hypothetical protein n=1 Tax=Variovorax boronicumulans TaxID=436515 RepID=UPI00277FAEFB|nr:hypothetical protein [Variovorax boronicumulans]MDQ0035910.1 hypothetical protein [Variovorax boronicumulans]
MTPDQHLANLKALIAPPYTNGWWAYAKARADELALENAANAALPTLLHAERERIKAEAEVNSPTKKRGASKPASTAQSKNVSRETTAATTSSEAARSGTGQPVFS